MNSLLLQYSYLQLLDLLTTIAFLRNGIDEANPIISALIQNTSSPLPILVLMKFIAIALAYYCWRIQKQQLLTTITVCYAILVAWNIVALIVGSGSMPSVSLPPA
jgi:hypothetical protein